MAAARDYQYHSGHQKINFRATSNCRMILLRGLVIFPKPFAVKGIDLYTGLRLLKVKLGE